MDRELDKKIAELRGEDFRGHLVVSNNVQFNETPHYSSKIQDAWPLFEELQSGSLHNLNKYWICEFFNPDTNQCEDWDAGTAPEAICLAWLAFKEAENGKTAKE